MSESATQAPTHEVILTDVAAAKVKSLLEQEGRDDLRLRIAVQPGGCSGLIYQLYFDDRMLDGDAIRSFDGVEVVVDRMSVPYLSGATIDFADTIERQASRSTTRTPRTPAPAANPPLSRKRLHPMMSSLRRLGALVGAAALVLGLAACNDLTSSSTSSAVDYAACATDDSELQNQTSTARARGPSLT